MTEQAAGVAQTLHPLVRRVLAPNPSAFSYTGTQTYLVGNGDSVAVIDPGPDLPDHVTATLTAIGTARVAAILCTHTHHDHSPASRALAAATGAPIIGCAPLALDDDGPRADAGFDPDYRPDTVLADGESVTGLGWTLTALATPGHTSNHLCFALPEADALFTGDHVMGWSTTVISPPDGDMADYMASLDKLIARADAIYFPAHGDPVERPQRFVRGLAGHRRQREGQILRTLEAGVGGDPGDGRAHVCRHRSAALRRRRPLGARPSARSRAARAGGAAGRRVGARRMIRPAARVAFGILAAVVLLIGLMLWGSERLRRTWAPDPTAIATASLQGLREQNRMSALVASYVAVVTSTQSRFGLSAQKTLILPGLVRYEVDLGKLGDRDVRWNAASRTLDVTLPPVEVVGPADRSHPDARI